MGLRGRLGLFDPKPRGERWGRSRVKRQQKHPRRGCVKVTGPDNIFPPTVLLDWLVCVQQSRPNFHGFFASLNSTFPGICPSWKKKMTKFQVSWSFFSENGNILSFGGRTSALTKCVSGVRSCLGSVCFFFYLVRLQRETYSVYKCEYRNIKILRAYSYQMMSPGSAQSVGFKFYPCFHWTTLPPWVWFTPQRTGLYSFIERLHTSCLVQSLEECLFLPDVSLTLKVIQSYYMLNPVLSGLRKANRIINCSAFHHEHVMCVGKSMHINNTNLLNLSWRHEKICYITVQ